MRCFIHVDVQRWQSTYVRYRGQQEGQVSQTGWELSASQGVQCETALPCLPYTPSSIAGAPLGIQMRITSAPAEFAVPVKQDR